MTGVYLYRLLEGGRNNLNDMIAQSDRLIGVRNSDVAAARRHQEAATRTKELAESRGEEYAAAFFKAFLERVPAEYQTAGLINSAARMVGLGPDFEKAMAEVDLVIADGSPDKIIDGYAKAFRDFGWEVTGDGQIEITAGIVVDAEAFRQHIAGRGIAESLAGIEIPAKIDLDENALNNDFSEFLKSFHLPAPPPSTAGGSPWADPRNWPAQPAAQAPASTGGAVANFFFGDGSSQEVTISPAAAVSRAAAMSARGRV